ncbi:MAG: PIN domain-containing protein [bacterium]
MRRVFVDANVFLRFFTQDDDGQHEKARALFTSAGAGKIQLVSGPPVLFEVAWTLRSAYAVSSGRILDILDAIAAFPGLSLSDEATVLSAISLARESGVEFADAYIAASAQSLGVDQVATFNAKDFKRLDTALYHW